MADGAGDRLRDDEMSDEEEGAGIIEDDYYTFLNVNRDAPPEEISNAYRRLSRLYHPDKHTDPERKKEADILFNKTKTAYEVLSDPHSRAIYDSLGVKGLETEGWEVVQRTKTPQEIREEYERLARARDERRLQQWTNPKSTFTVNVNATEMFTTYDEDDYNLEPSMSQMVEVSGMNMTQSIEAPLTMRDTLILAGQLMTHNGNGSGSVNCTLRRNTSNEGYAEFHLGAGNGLTLGLRGFRTLWRHAFANVAFSLPMLGDTIIPELSATLGNQLGKHTVGYLTWRNGGNSGVHTSVVRDTEHSHVTVAFQLGVPHTYLMLSYTAKLVVYEAKLRGAVRGGTFGAMVEVGAEKKVSKHSTMSATISVGVPTGVRLKIKLLRANQVYNFPIHLSEEILPSPIFYGTVIPILTWYVVKRLLIDPYVQQQQQKDKEKQREVNKGKIVEKKREAEAAIRLMEQAYLRISGEEEQRKGLVVLEAHYGRLVNEVHAADDLEVVDVTVPLQCLVKDSKLLLHEASKSQLPGFFDPCVGEEKFLRVKYKFHDHLHEVTVGDADVLRIPKQSHRVNPS